MKSLLVFCVIAALTLPQVMGFCCPWVVNKQVKCECPNGDFVHPYDCCATGKCNIFCCNCAGECPQKNGTEESGREKRAAGEFNPVAAHFHSLDLNRDLMLDLSETLTHLKTRAHSQSQASIHHTVAVAQLASQSEESFASMDVNGDGFITPNEMDSGLTENDVIYYYYEEDDTGESVRAREDYMEF